MLPPPTTEALLQIRGQKTCGPLQRYASRTIALHPEGVYCYLDGMTAPYSFLSLAGGASIAQNSDSPSGFSIYTEDGEKKTKFKLNSVDEKQLWIDRLQQVIQSHLGAGVAPRIALNNNLAASTDAADALRSHDISSPTASRLSFRTSTPLVEGFVLRRSGISNYNARWCEVHTGVGLLYSKYKSDADDAFKLVPLRGATVRFNDAKLRIQIDDTERSDIHYMRFASQSMYDQWKAIIAQEADPSEYEERVPSAAAGAGGGKSRTGDTTGGGGDTWVVCNNNVPANKQLLDAEASGLGESGAFGAFSRKVTTTAQDDVDDDDDDTALEVADLESPTPLFPEKIAVELPSLSRSICADLDSPGFDRLLEQWLLQRGGPLGFRAMLQTFQERLFVPLIGPYAALNKHLSLLDLDASVCRQVASELVTLHPRETRAAQLAQKVDTTLQWLTKVREVYMIRRDICEFREQQNQLGLRQGIDGTLENLRQTWATYPSSDSSCCPAEIVARVSRLIQGLAGALHQFRLEFDFYDDAKTAIDDVEATLKEGRTWLATRSL